MYMQQERAASMAAVFTGFTARVSGTVKGKSGQAFPEQASGGSELEIQSRFGAVTARKESAIFFPYGLLGLPPSLHFVVTDIPRYKEQNLGHFKLLQCLNDHSVSFIVLPIDMDNTIVAREDISEACRALNVREENLLTLLIVSVQRSPDSLRVTVNARAPVIVDVADKAAIQYVFPTSKYEICHLLTK